MFGTDDSQILSPLKISLEDRVVTACLAPSISKATKLPRPCWVQTANVSVEGAAEEGDPSPLTGAGLGLHFS